MSQMCLNWSVFLNVSNVLELICVLCCLCVSCVSTVVLVFLLLVSCDWSVMLQFWTKLLVCFSSMVTELVSFPCSV